MHKYREDTFHLSPLWDGILAIYDEYRRICEKFNLRYYVIGGTMIGAVRHHGFIPWDDDFDVAMPREDYEKFRKIVQSELLDWYKFTDWRNSGFSLMFGKIQDTRENKVLEVEQRVGYQLSNGIYIDIFPLDGMPEKKLPRCLLLKKLKVLACIERFRHHSFAEQTLKGKLCWLIGSIISCFASGNVYETYDKELSRRPFNIHDAVLMAGITLKYPIIYPPFKDDKHLEMKFEDRVVRVPSNFDEILRSYFGDYMRLPPEDQRKPSHSYPTRCEWWLGPTK